MNPEALMNMGDAPVASADWGLRSHRRGLGRGGSLGFSRVTRRAGSGGKSLIFTHCKTLDELSSTSVS